LSFATGKEITGLGEREETFKMLKNLSNGSFSNRQKKHCVTIYKGRITFYGA